MRKATRIPFSADVRSWPHDHPEAHLVDQLDKLFKFGEINLALDRLMVVPEYIGLYRVKACPLEFQEAVAPKLARASAVVKGAAVDERILAVQGEALRIIADDLRILELALVLPGFEHKQGLRHAPSFDSPSCAARGALKANCRNFRRDELMKGIPSRIWGLNLAFRLPEPSEL